MSQIPPDSIKSQNKGKHPGWNKASFFNAEDFCVKLTAAHILVKEPFAIPCPYVKLLYFESDLFR